MTNAQNIRIIFGLKLRQLRQKRGLKPKELAKKAGISVSYLNEIEKGKKYPTNRKVIALVEALQVSYEELVSPRLERNLAPVNELLNSNLLQLLPLEKFGISIEDLVDIIASSPAKVSAFIQTLIEIGRNYEMRLEQFHFAALRSYQQMHDNYFEEIENQVQCFLEEFKLAEHTSIPVSNLHHILTQHYQYTIDEHTLQQHPELRSVRSVWVRQRETSHLLVNNNLTDTQKAFQLGKELGYQYLAIANRPITTTQLKVASFDQLLNNFKASYFASALLINQQHLIAAVQQLFASETWKGNYFLHLMQHYQVSPETFMHRLTNILPRFFGLNQLFFLRFENKIHTEIYNITKELHLTQRHNPHGNEINEKYCRRWITINVLKELKQLQQQKQSKGPIIRVQRSKYINSNREYFCITIARAMYPTPDTNSSVTIGLLVNEQLKQKVKFWNDPKVLVRLVNETCQRCGLVDCVERAAPPNVLDKQAKMKRMEDVVAHLVKQFQLKEVS